MHAAGLDIDSLKLKLLSLFRSADYKAPLLPAVAVELLELSKKAKVNAGEIADLLGRDPLLAGQTLRIAQSASYAGASPVRSLDDAIVRLGLSRVTDLFFQAALEMRIFRAPGYDTEMEALRRHCSFTADTARLVCRRTLGFDDYAFLCGLLHDVGVAACILAMEELGRGGDKVPFELAWPSVKEIHQSCSELLANIWRLPPDLATVLKLHHRLAQDGHIHPLAAVVATADGLAAEFGFGFHGESGALDTESAARFLGLHDADVSRLRAATEELANAQARA
jgi:HD-like signal output (HDOD) protein